MDRIPDEFLTENRTSQPAFLWMCSSTSAGHWRASQERHGQDRFLGADRGLCAQSARSATRLWPATTSRSTTRCHRASCSSVVRSTRLSCSRSGKVKVFAHPLPLPCAIRPIHLRLVLVCRSDVSPYGDYKCVDALAISGSDVHPRSTCDEQVTSFLVHKRAPMLGSPRNR